MINPFRRLARLLSLFIATGALASAQEASTPVQTSAEPRPALQSPTASRTPGGAVRVTVLPPVGEDLYIAEGHRQSGDAISILGSTVIRGEVTGESLTVAGDTTIIGTVRRDSFTLGGDATVEGAVDGDVVVFLGDLTLGPGARVRGAHVFGGRIHLAEGAQVQREIVQVPYGRSLRLPRPISAWWTPPGLVGLWKIFAGMTAVYLLLGLAFPAGIRRCGDTLIRRPAATFFTAMLGLLAVPLLVALLLISVIGVPVALVIVPLGVLFAVLFGNASVLALIGRSFLRDRFSVPISILGGAAVFALFYLVPIVALPVALVMGLFGFGAVLATLSEASGRRAEPAAPLAVPDEPPDDGPASGDRIETEPPPAPVPAAPRAYRPPAVYRAGYEEPEPAWEDDDPESEEYERAPAEPAVRASAGFWQAFSTFAGRVLVRDRFSIPMTVVGIGLMIAAFYLVRETPLPVAIGISLFGFCIVLAALYATAPRTPAADRLGRGEDDSRRRERNRGGFRMQRAGFWRRFFALILDCIVVVIGVGLPLLAFDDELVGLVLPALAIYAVLMWRCFGTTIGGVICNVRIERLDGRPLGFGTAVVRCLGCFLSAVVAMLGFIWIAVDAENQAWHDKIAGTVVVRPPPTTSLI